MNLQGSQSEVFLSLNLTHSIVFVKLKKTSTTLNAFLLIPFYFQPIVTEQLCFQRYAVSCDLQAAFI